MPHSENDLLAAALSFLAFGWCIIPCRGKKPALNSWKPFQLQPPSADELATMVSAAGVTGIAVVHGAVSGGLVCRDFDDVNSYDTWAREHPDLAATLPTAETARGRHVYFLGPENFENCGDGEYRGDSKHYTLLPPSMHPSGVRYRWIIPATVEIPFIPDPVSMGLMNPVQHRTTQKYSEVPASPEELKTSTAIPEESRPTQTQLTSCADLYSPALQDIEAVIRKTMPAGPGKRHKLVFELARHLKAIPHLADATLTVLRPIVARWHEAAMPFIGTKEFAETWFDFLRGWGKVKFPAGQSPLEVALKRAEQSPPPDGTEVFGPKVQRLAGLCRELQRSAGDAPFFLGCRTVSTLFGVDPATAWRWLEMFAIEGILVKVETGALEKRLATSWRWCGTA